MLHANLVSTFSETIYRLIRMGHESFSVLNFGFNNLKCVIPITHASGISVSIKKYIKNEISNLKFKSKSQLKSLT